jgi:hypothetical protein
MLQKKKLLTRLVFALAVISSFCFLSCASSGFGPRGLLYTNTKVGMFGTGSKGKLSNQSCVISILGLFSFGDASIQTLKDQAKIETITETNWNSFSILSIYAKLCVQIYGN